jgi:hypothetical protein
MYKTTNEIEVNNFAESQMSMGTCYKMYGMTEVPDVPVEVEMSGLRKRIRLHQGATGKK